MTATTNTEALAAEYVALKARATEVDDRMKAIIAELRNLGAGTHTAGIHTVSVSDTPRRFNPDHAAEVLASNPELLAACQETIITAARAKKVLPPAIYDVCSIPSGEPRVTIR